MCCGKIKQVCNVNIMESLTLLLFISFSQGFVTRQELMDEHLVASLELSSFLFPLSQAVVVFLLNYQTEQSLNAVHCLNV